MCRRIGITGGSGSGKGYICALLNEMGYPCIDTDAVVHTLYSTNEDCLNDLRHEFGDEIFESGTVVRPRLANIVFSDANKLKKLNSIVHRYVISECDRLCASFFKNGHKVVFIDAPQLYEAGMDKVLDAVIAVIAPNDVRLKRIVERDSISKPQALSRINNQHSDDFFIENADFIIENASSSENELKNRLKEIIIKLCI